MAEITCRLISSLTPLGQGLIFPHRLILLCLSNLDSGWLHVLGNSVYYHGVLHILEQLLGLKQQGDIQNHVAVSWGEVGKPPSSILQAHAGD